MLTGFVVSEASAQAVKGTIWAGGHLSAGQYNYQGIIAKRTSTQLTPQAGVFLSKSLLVGLKMPISYNSTRFEKPEQVNELKTIKGPVLGFSPFLRKYILIRKVSPFIQADISYKLAKGERIYQQGTSEKLPLNTYFSGSAGLGITYFVSDKLSVDATIDASILNLKNAFKTLKSSGNRQFMVGVGANWYWERKR